MTHELKILYEDNHIIAVFKPAGLLVQPAQSYSADRHPPTGGRGRTLSGSGGDESGAPNLLDETKKYLKEKYQKPGNVFLGLVHRLDRPVSGIVLFAKTSKGASRLSGQFRERTAKKIYHAVVHGRMSPSSGTLKHYLRKDEQKKIALVSAVPRDGYDEAILSYEVLQSVVSRSLLVVHLHTGRFHQIRAQLSETGHPVVGDAKYGSREKLSGGSIALCATDITFRTATTDEIKTLSISIPETWEPLLRSPEERK